MWAAPTEPERAPRHVVLREGAGPGRRNVRGGDDDSSSDGGGGDGDGWGSQGRVGVYAFNVGDIRRPDFRDAVVANLASCVGHLLLGCECTISVADEMEAEGWMVSDRRFIGHGRGEGGDGLMVAARSSVCSALLTHEASGTFWPRGGRDRSAMLFCRAEFRWGLSGMGSLEVGVFHLHRLTARRGANSPHMQELAARVSRQRTPIPFDLICSLRCGSARLGSLIGAA